MIKETKITSKLTSIFLGVALLFSFSSEALHIFSHSDFNHCTETGTTHLHQLDAECDVFDFHITPVLSLSSHSIQPQTISNFKTIFPPVGDKLFFTATFHISLRGPPKSV
ncbi:hypothetical protein [uncultured Planktosalinus sp.]|uniref:hypothetical protein n=1 Tax=uncultured Planktosalinus sp. TaxID=1810935 RepID=UPI0030DA6E0B